MFQFGIDNDMMDGNHMLNVKPVKGTFNTEVITKEEYLVYTDLEAAEVCKKAYEDALQSHETACLGVILLFNLGLRCSELLGLKWSDITVNGDEGIIHIQRTQVATIDPKTKKAKGTEIADRCKTKAGNRELYVSKDVLKIFDMIKEIAIERGFPCEENDYVFMRKYRGKICICTERCIDSRLRKYCGKTNMVAKSAHDIRRTTITTLSNEANEGMRINDIQKWAGHQNASMTQSYIKSQAGTDNKNYLNALNPLQITE